MSETESWPSQPVGTSSAPARPDDLDQYRSEFDFAEATAWVRNNYVLVAGLLLVLAEIIWKAQLLSHMFFTQDDYVNLDIAITSPFSWHYLTLIGAGHFFPGVRAVAWVLARVSLYDWGLDAGLVLLLAAAAGLAALRLLRTLFGDRPAILIPLVIYALTPLTVPDLGWWWCAIESLPLQLAIFMALNSHVLYVRSGRGRHLAAAAAWLVVGMLFFEKAIVLAPLLFAFTAAFLMGARSWLAGALATLRQHIWAWLVYGVLMIGYAVLFIVAFSNSGQQATGPSSLSAAWTFALTMVKDTLMTGALGGPWHWLPVQNGFYGLAAPPAALVFLAGLAVVVVLIASIMLSPIAWRAWAILIGWVVCADMLPIVFGRLYPGLQNILGLETRYVADAACLLAICVGLAFLPVIGSGQKEPAAVSDQTPVSSRGLLVAVVGEQRLRYVATALVAAFLVGSIWSVRAYESITPGPAVVRTYVANFKKAVRLAPHDTKVLDQYMPQQLVEGALFGKKGSAESAVIGDLARGKLAGRLTWIGNPVGTIDGLRMFGSDGRLYPAVIAGVYSVHRPGTGLSACWPERRGRVVVKLQSRTSIFDYTLQISYIWGAAPRSVTVQYGNSAQRLTVTKGVHSAYLPVHGHVTGFAISGLGGHGICVGSSEAGRLVPYGPPVR
ncbi:MAG TPA: hypothetical protein VFQ44_09890 [Streptosporangiaceae bacterium]|nr:hypothetical protein [Streptosporangiaceae bacterium]